MSAPARGRQGRRAGAAVLAALVVAVAAFGWSVPAAGADPARAGRVLVLSVPGLTWAEVRDHDLPHIRALLDQSGLADLAPRGVSAHATPGAAYLTISGGSRATSDPLVDGQQLAVDDHIAGSSAGDIFTRRTGVRPDGAAVSLAWPQLQHLNKAQPYDTVLGLLTATLERAGRGAAAIGNADGTDTLDPSYERQVGLAAATKDGVVRAGALGDDLVVHDASRPFGERLNTDAVVRSFQDAWQAPGGRQGGMVVVEASDLARSMRYRDRVDQARYDQLRSRALADSDALVGRLVAEVDPARDAVLLVAPYNLPGDRDLTVAALRAPGWAPGYLRSASTQRAGFLTLVDVGPTVLDLLGVDRPEQMEGRPAEPAATSAPLRDRIDHLVDENAASRFREQLLFPTTLAIVIVLAGLCAGAMVAVARRGPRRLGRALAFVALADLAVMPLSYLARAFPLEDLGAGFYWAFITTGALVLAAVATLVAGRLDRPRLALVGVLAMVAAVPVLDVVTGSRLSLSAAFGYSATGNSRLYGISNYSYGQVAAAVCLLAAFVAGRWPTRRGRAASIALLVAVLVVFGMPTWGADVGGILAFTPTVLVFAALITGYRLRLRLVAVGVAATAVAITAFGLLDLARPPDQRSHLGRLFERVGNEGLGPLFSIVQRKLVANLHVSTTSFWVAAIPVAVIFLVFLARYPTQPLAQLRAALPTLPAGLTAALVAAALGSALNDSGAIVGGVALTVVAAALAWLALDLLVTPGGAAEPDAPPPPPAVADDDGAVATPTEPVAAGAVAVGAESR